MKKTIIALMALAGVAVATEKPVPAWTLNDVSLSGNTEYTTDDNNVTLSSLGISCGENAGYTAMITMNWTKVSNAPAFWFSTTAGAGYANSTATLGYRGGFHHACLFSTGGGNGGCTDSYVIGNDNPSSNVPDYIADHVGNDAYNTSLKDTTVTYFITSSEGTAVLYELMNDGNVTQIATHTGMATGTLGSLVVSHWNTANTHQDGTMDIQLYSSVLSTTQMKALVPEPTTATLSLLALAGLAARRRRK